jgi:Tfp pilus assembly protein PilF
MRITLFSLISLFGCALASSGAESNDPADHFLNAYTAFQKAEKAEGEGKYNAALTGYKVVVKTLDQISTRWPSWNPPVVKHRRERATEAVTRVQPRAGKPGDKSAPDEDAGPPMPANELSLIPDELPAAESGRPAPPPRARTNASGDPIFEIQTRLKTLEDDLRATREKLERETAEKEELARKYENAIKSTEESARKQVIAEGRAQRAEDALMRAETDVAKNSESIKALRAEAEAARKAVREIQMDREAGEELRHQFADRLASAGKRIEALAQERDATRKESADMPKKLAEMQKQIDKVLKEKGDVSTKLAKVETRLQEVTEERDQALIQVAKMKEAQKQVDKLIADNTALMAKLDTAEATITRFKSEGVKKDEEIASLKKEVGTVKTQLAQAKKQSADYQQQMSELQTQLDTQAKDLAQVKTNGATSLAERKKLQQENDILRGIVIRQQKEQAVRDGKRKLVLSELSKLELNSKALVAQIEYLASPVVKLTAKERKLFKQPLMEISDAEISLATAKEGGASEESADSTTAAATAETKPANSEATSPTANAIAETGSATEPPPVAPAGTEAPGDNAPVAPPATAEAKPPVEIADAKTGSPTPEMKRDESETKGAVAEEKQDTVPVPPEAADRATAPPPATSPIEVASAKTPGKLPSTTPAEGDLPTKDANESKDAAAPAPAVTTSMEPNVPPEMLGLARQAKEHFERANYREAEKAYEKILGKAPNNLYALSNLGVVRFRSGKLKLAEEAFKKAIAVAPEDAFSHCTLGIVYYSQGKYDDAVNELTRAVAINPKNATAHNYLGITASQKGWQEAAQTELEAATALDPNYADAFFNLAVVFATQQPPNKETARKHYKRATELGAEPDTALEQLIK